ncbi:MAG: helix-turn-helix transcriptional regulator [Taibaiella sp.]|jgi:transcriptional regulator with XRE-family HTH domain
MNRLLKNIRFLRQLRQYSQRYMADRLSMTQSNYARIEAGSVLITDHTLRNIATVLGYSTEVLMQLNSDTMGREPVQLEVLPDVAQVSDDIEKRISKLEQHMNDVFNAVVNLTQLISCRCNKEADHS